MINRFGLLVYASITLLAAQAPASTSETPRMDSDNGLTAQVTIPYQEFKRLFDAATIAAKSEDNPGIPGVVSRETIKLSLDPAHPSGEAEFEINTFGNKWAFVPFFGLDLPITNVVCEGAVILPRDAVLCLLTNKSGLTKVTLNFDIPDSLLSGHGEPVSLHIVPATSGQLEFSNVPAGKRVLIGGKAADLTKSWPLVPEGGEIKIACVADNPESPTVWSQITQTLVKPTFESIEIETHIHLSGRSGSGLSASTELPITTSKFQVEGTDLQPAQITVSTSGHKKISLTWETAGILDRNIIVRYQLPNPEPGRPWEIESPRFGEEIDPKGGLTVIAPLPGSTIQGDNGQTSSEIAQSPYWMQSNLVTSDVYVIRAVNPVTVSTQLLPVLKPDNARILAASYQTGLVPDGSLKCEAGFKIEYRNAFSWRFRLPNGSALLDCQVSSNPASPVIRGDGELELAIPAPPKSGTVNSILILISYTARTAKFEPVEGKLDLSLPSTQLFIERLEWRLYLPGAYEATAFEGNVEPGGSGGDTSIVFYKNLLRAETPNLQIYYRKKEGEAACKP